MNFFTSSKTKQSTTKTLKFRASVHLTEKEVDFDLVFYLKKRPKSTRQSNFGCFLGNFTSSKKGTNLTYFLVKTPLLLKFTEFLVLTSLSLNRRPAILGSNFHFDLKFFSSFTIPQCFELKKITSLLSKRSLKSEIYLVRRNFFFARLSFSSILLTLQEYRYTYTKSTNTSRTLKKSQFWIFTANNFKGFSVCFLTFFEKCSKSTRQNSFQGFLEISSTCKTVSQVNFLIAE